jgi:3-hydroxyisobutyrate dehydrogenase-like beta-hydroxyacid dehydrogenase
MQRIGIIGLGAMGRPMARHLIAKGFTICGYDPDATAQDKAAALSVTVVASPAEVARASELVLIVVGFDAQVEKVFFGEQGLRARASSSPWARPSHRATPASWRTA